MKKVGIILDEGFHDLELWVPYYRLKEEKVDFDILAWENRWYKGAFGIDSITPTKLLSEPLADYKMVFFPGAKSPENLLKRKGTVDIVKKMSDSGTHFATICHSPLLLAEADMLREKKVAGHPSIKPEMEKAGAIFVDSPVVRTSERILSGRTHFDLAAFMPEFMNSVKTL